MSEQTKLGQQKLRDPNNVGEALLILRKFGFQATALDDNLFSNARNLVRLNNELFEAVGSHSVCEPVKWFAEQMEQRLKANDHKTGWDKSSTSWLCEQASRKLTELCIAGSHKRQYRNSEEIARLAADVANFAMMIADNARRFVKESESSE